jgi:hypothetical protein
MTSSARDSWLAFAQWVADTPLLRQGVSAPVSPSGGVPRHGVPQIPVMIDEAETDARSVLDLHGQALTTVVDRDALDGRMLHIFTDRERAGQYLEAAEAPLGQTTQRSEVRSPTRITSAAQALTAGVPPGGGVIELWEDINLGGCGWRVPEWEHVAFNYSTKWACGFLFWGWKNADKVVSSIDCVYSADLVNFFDMPNLSGSTLAVSPGVFRINDLTQLGWNDRISSQIAFYFS